MENNDYLVPQNADQELKRELHLSFIGFTIFDIAHIAIALFMMVVSLVNKAAGWQDEISECIIEIIFASLLITFVEGLAHHQSDIRAFRKYYSYAFTCANAALLVPLTLAVTGKVTFELNFHYSLLVVICFATTLLTQVFFFVGIFVNTNHKVWRLFMLFGVILLTMYSPLMIASLFVNMEEFSWETIIHIIHYLVPEVLAVIAFVRLSRKAKDSILY